MFMLCVVSKDKQAKCRTIKTKKQEGIKYKQTTREYKKNYSRVHGLLCFSVVL